MIWSSGLDVSSLGALGVILGALVGAYGSVRIVGPNRRKIIEDANTTATTRATVALEAALDRYEADNGRLRDDVDELEERVEACMRRLQAAERDRDRHAARIERMLARFDELGIEPPR